MLTSQTYQGKEVHSGRWSREDTSRGIKGITHVNGDGVELDSCHLPIGPCDGRFSSECDT